MSGDVHVRFCEGLGVRFPGARLVMGFSNESDVKRVMAVLPKRFNRFGLTIHPEKTKLIDFRPPTGREDRTSFDFLGVHSSLGYLPQGLSRDAA